MNTSSTPLSPSLQEPTAGPPFGLAWTRDDWFAVILVISGVAVAMVRFWQPGIAGEADMLMGIYRLVDLDKAWQHGILLPRLGLDLNFTYTAPLFQFYPPLGSILALVFHWIGLGWIESAKAVFTLSLLLGGLGVYGYARWLLQNRLAALVSSLAYVFAPYLLVVAYERGAMAEGLAWALTPWLFWMAHRVVVEERRRDLLAMAVLTALLVLAHNLTALFVLPAVAIYAVVLAWRSGVLRRLPALAGALALGLGLSAFYWLPAIAEARFTRMEATMFSGGLTPAVHLTPWRTLVQSTLVVDPWGPLHFRLALWPAVLGGASLLLLPSQAPRRRLALALLAVLWLIVMVLQLTVARPFWEDVPLVRSIQFPWRLIGLASFCIALLVGSAFVWPPLLSRPGAVLAALVLAGFVLFSTSQLKPELSPIWYRIENSQITRADLFERGRAGYALFYDYQPLTQQAPSSDLSLPRPAGSTELPPLATSPHVEVAAQSPLAFTLRIRSDQPFPVRLPRVFFPGWRAALDGTSLPVSASGQHGLVTVEAPAGEHEVVVRYRGTPLQQVAAVISLAALGVLVVWLARTRRGRIALAVALVALAIVSILGLLHRGQGAPIDRPVAATARFSDEIDLIGYSLPKTTWQPGETIPIRLFWFAQQAPSADYKVFLHVIPADDSAVVAQSDSPPMMGFSPTTRWEPGQVVVDEQSIELGAGVAPGTYRLVAGLYHPDTLTNLPIVGAAEVLPGDRLPLGEIEIQN